MNQSIACQPPSASSIRLALVGDVVGKPGRRMVCDSVGYLRKVLHIDTIIVNAENVADGSGIRCKDYQRLIEAGVDVITLGDHLYKKREIIDVLTTQQNIVRPLNLPSAAPGRGWTVVTARGGVPVAVCSLLGRVFMKPIDCPFRAADQALLDIDVGVRIRMIDFHAEATSDKQLMGRFLDGRVTAVIGTHTHVATADEQILAGGTGFQCDAGMTGPFDGILGRKTDAVLEATLTSLPIPFQVSTGDVRLNATWFDADIATGKCLAIGRIELCESTLAKWRASTGPDMRVL